VTIALAIPSRYFAVAAIMARAESLTLEGACPSAQLMVVSAVVSEQAVCDHLLSVILSFQGEGDGSVVCSC
jgi:hypothetical protein